MKKLLAILFAVMTLAALMIPMFASAASAEPTAMWVNCADGRTLNVRADASTKARVLYRLECGTMVEVNNNVAAPKGWAFVTVRGHRDGGFVMTKFLVSRQPGKYEITERADNFREVTPYTVEAKARTGKTQDSVGLRVTPNKTARMIRRLAAGDLLQVVAVGKTWSRVIDLTTGQTGYVANDYIVRK